MDVTAATDMDRGEEGRTTRAIEKRTSRAPSGLFLALAFGSMAVSASIMASERGLAGKFAGRRRFGSLRGLRGGNGRGDLANFVGHWAPTLLVMGLYNKVVKLERELTGLP